MTVDTDNVFFYGLFMDVSLLSSMGVRTYGSAVGYVDGYALRMGARATLVPAPGARAYGVLIKVASDDLAALYADASVRDYQPTPVTAILTGGMAVKADCYVLPTHDESRRNPEYGAALLELATDLGFPEDYLAEISRTAGLA